MRFSTLMTIAAVAGSVTTAAGQSPAAGGQPAAQNVLPTAPAPPIVQIGLFGYRADGNASSMAYDTEPSLSSTVHIRTSQGSCLMGAGIAQPAGATDIWRFAGKILSSSPEEVVVQLDWQRTLAGGTEVGAPGSSQVLTLRAGDRVLLDSVTPPACWTTVGFEARYMPRPFVGTIAYRPQGGGGGGGGMVRVSGWRWRRHGERHHGSSQLRLRWLWRRRLQRPNRFGHNHRPGPGAIRRQRVAGAAVTGQAR